LNLSPTLDGAKQPATRLRPLLRPHDAGVLWLESTDEHALGSLGMLPLFVAWALALNPKGRATSTAPSTDDGPRGATLDSRANPSLLQDIR